MKSLCSGLGKKVYEFPADVIDMVMVEDTLVVKCEDGITYLVTEKMMEEFKKKQGNNSNG